MKLNKEQKRNKMVDGTKELPLEYQERVQDIINTLVFKNMKQKRA